MTEHEWLSATDPTPPLEFLRDRGAVSERKLRLTACGIHRSVWTPEAGGHTRAAVEVAERFADGLAGRPEVAVARNLFRAGERSRLRAAVAASGSPEGESEAVVWAAGWDAAKDCLRVSGWDSVLDVARAAAVATRYGRRGIRCEPSSVLRDIFGNPFRPVTFQPEWKTSAALSIATMMYDSRDFTAAPVLADALQDGGCESEDILDHLRGPGPHVRGCHVLDRILGKE